MDSDRQAVWLKITDSKVILLQAQAPTICQLENHSKFRNRLACPDKRRMLSKDLNNTFRRKALKVSDFQALSQLWTGCKVVIWPHIVSAY